MKNTVKYEGAFTNDTRKTINDNFRDASRVSSSLSITSGSGGTTLQNVSGMVTDKLDKGAYTFRITLGTVATANSGLKLALKQSVSSMLTEIEYQVKAYTASGVAVSRGTTATDAASLLASTTAIIAVEITGTVVMAAEGTLQLQAAQNASHADTTSIFKNSFMEFQKIA